MVRKYEGVFILRPEVEKDALEQQISVIQEIMTKQGGKVDQWERWGKRPLAYRVQKQTEGQYIMARFTLDSKNVQALEQNLKLREDILRFMVVK